MPAGRSPRRKAPAARKPARGPDPQVSERNPATQVSAPDPAQLARFEPLPPPGVSRVCAYCCTRQPVTSMQPWGTGMICADMAGCDRRAAGQGLYPQREDELEIAAVEARSGAVT